MSPNQGPKALLEVSNHDLDYQTISKVDKLIVESSCSTRRIQRAQEHRIPTSLKPSFSLKRDPREEEKKRRREEEKEGGKKKLLLDHRRSSAGPPLDAGVLPDRHLTPEIRRTTT
ncbi:hypothetical protein M5K25_020113 [Dendrobium thyrsiflorum]|uniref:Uncharacterized protein n=1 Tax=Dendrobium thyrsiflorum TaxID=117978 RepID=A0ABD0U991_DENTH